MKKVHRFIGNFDLTQETLTLRDDLLVRQLKDVLRLRVGEEIALGNGRGIEARAKILSFSSHAVSVELLRTNKVTVEVPVAVTLYAALLKNDNFEFILEKATEVGVERVVPLISARTVKKGMRRERWETIVREAAEQAGRAHVPELSEALSFTDALEVSRAQSRAIFFDQSGIAVGELSPHCRGGSLALFVGPEGGWEDVEVEHARRAGMPIVSLGRLVLRAETAATIATYLAASGLL